MVTVLQQLFRANNISRIDVVPPLLPK